MWTVIYNSLNLDFIDSDIQGESFKKNKVVCQ